MNQDFTPNAFTMTIRDTEGLDQERKPLTL